MPIKRLWLAVFGGYLALGSTLQSVTPFVVERLHAGPAAAGTAVGIAFLATALVRPFAGRAADAGRARPVVLLGGVLGALGGVGHLLAPNLVVLLLARLVMGAGEAALFSGALPWVLQSAPPHQRGRFAGWFGLSMWGGLALGPLLAEALHARWDYPGVWRGVVVLGLVSAALVAAAPAQPRTEPVHRAALVPKGATTPGVVLGLASFGYGTIAALVVLYLRQESLGGDGVALAVFSAVFLATRALGSPLVDRFGGARVALVTLAVEAAGLLLVTGVHTSVTALLGTAVTGAGVALIYPASVRLVLDRTSSPPGASLAVMTSFWDLGIMVAGPLAGLVAASAGYPAAFDLAVAAALGAVVLTATTTAAALPDHSGHQAIRP